MINLPKIIALGILNYFLRFAVGGFLLYGLQMNPIGFVYGLILTVAAFIFSALIFKFLVKVSSLKEALTVAGIWVVIALILDAITALTLLHLSLDYIFAEIQTWTRVIVIPLATVTIFKLGSKTEKV